MTARRDPPTPAQPLSRAELAEKRRKFAEALEIENARAREAASERQRKLRAEIEREGLGGEEP